MFMVVLTFLLGLDIHRYLGKRLQSIVPLCTERPIMAKHPLRFENYPPMAKDDVWRTFGLAENSSSPTRKDLLGCIEIAFGLSARVDDRYEVVDL